MIGRYLLALMVIGATSLGAADSDARAKEGQGIRIWSLPGKKVPAPSLDGGGYTARILITSAVWRNPGGSRALWLARSHTRWSGGPQRLMVLSSRLVEGRFWLKVRLPTRPNGTSGWIARDRVRLGLSRHSIRVDLSRRRLSVFRRGRVVAGFRAVVGAPSTPTPTGLFALHERVAQGDRQGFVGPLVLTLTAFSNVLRRFAGGPGLVAIHGRGPESLSDQLGSARSRGCVRINNSRVRYLSQLDLGTPVQIRP